MNVISEINTKAKSYSYLEFCIYSISKEQLIIAGSDDLMYYHTFEVIFINPHSIICNTEWIANPSKQVFYEISRTEEAKKINLDFEVLVGNKIFKMLSQDGAIFYIVAEDIKLAENIIKYY